MSNMCFTATTMNQISRSLETQKYHNRNVIWTANLDTMEYFNIVNSQLQYVGFGKAETIRDKITNIIRRVICLAIMSNQALSIVWFCAFEAETFGDFMNPLLMFFNATTCITIYLMVCRQSERFNELFDLLQRNMEKCTY